MSDVTELLAGSLNGAREILEQVVQGLTTDQLQAAPGGTANPIASLYAHAYISDDFSIALLGGVQPLWLQGWAQKVGGNTKMGAHLDESYHSLRLDLASFKPYADAVAARSQEVVRAMSPADLEKQHDMGGGWIATGRDVVRDFMAWHIAFHTGEISSQKGAMGLRGIPF